MKLPAHNLTAHIQSYHKLKMRSVLGPFEMAITHESSSSSRVYVFCSRLGGACGHLLFGYLPKIESPDLEAVRPKPGSFRGWRPIVKHPERCRPHLGWKNAWEMSPLYTIYYNTCVYTCRLYIAKGPGSHQTTFPPGETASCEGITSSPEVARPPTSLQRPRKGGAGEPASDQKVHGG